MKKLDQHLFAAEEIQDVYDEITKTMSQDHLQFDKVWKKIVDKDKPRLTKLNVK